MIDVHVLSAFSVELQKEGGVASGVAGAIKETGTVLRKAIDPTKLKSTFQHGMHELSNMTAAKQQARKAFSSGERGALSQMADRFRSTEGIRRSRARAARIGRQYVDDFSQGSGTVAKLRRQGWLSGGQKYTGDSKVRKGLNMARRALPGEKTFQVAQMGQGVHSALQDKTDQETGRKKGLGERLGKATMGVTTGMAGMGHGWLASTAAGMAGEHIGGSVGRGVDAVAAKLRGKAQTATGAAPHPTGAG